MPHSERENTGIPEWSRSMLDHHGITVCSLSPCGIMWDGHIGMVIAVHHHGCAMMMWTTLSPTAMTNPTSSSG